MTDQERTSKAKERAAQKAEYRAEVMRGMVLAMRLSNLILDKAVTLGGTELTPELISTLKAVIAAGQEEFGRKNKNKQLKNRPGSPSIALPDALKQLEGD